MPNEITIRVKAIQDTKTVFDKVRADAKKLGDDIGIVITTTSTARMEQQAGSGQGGYGRAGDAIGRTIGDRVGRSITERIRSSVQNALNRVRRDSDGDTTSGARSGGLAGNERIKVDVDVDRPSFLQRIAGLGRDGASRFGQAFRSGLGVLFNGDIISVALKVLLGGLVATFGSSAIGAALSATILAALGGGAIAIGIAGAMQDPRIKAAVDALGTRVKALFTTFGNEFRGVVENFIAPGNAGGGGLAGLLEQLTPMVERLAKVLAPVAGKLGDGIIGMLQNLLPPIIRAMEDSAPVVEMLAAKLPELGQEIGEFFNKIGKNSPEAAQFLGDLLELFGEIIGAVGTLVSNLTWLYGVFRRILLQMFVGLADLTLAFYDAFGWMPGIGPKLRGVADRFRGFRESAVRELRRIEAAGDNIQVSVRFRVLGLAAMQAGLRTARILAGMGYSHGGVAGQAASGGARSGLTWVGEHGPELAELPPGTRVHSNPDSQRMVSQAGGGGGTQIIQLVVDGRVLAQATVDPMRNLVRNAFGGSVQAAYGFGG